MDIVRLSKAKAFRWNDLKAFAALQLPGKRNMFKDIIHVHSPVGFGSAGLPSP